MPKDEPKTQYTPRGEEIPIPTREQVLRDLAKASQPVEKPKRKRRRGSR